MGGPSCPAPISAQVQGQGPPRGRNPGLKGELTPLPRPFPNPKRGLEEGGRPYSSLPLPPLPHLAPPPEVLARPTDPSSPSPGHCGPEEAPPVRVLEDVGQHADEQAAAAQHNLPLLLRVAAALGSLHQLLDCLRGWAERRAAGGVRPRHLGSGWAPRASGGAWPTCRAPSPDRVSQPWGDRAWAREQPGASGSGAQPTTRRLRPC